MAIDRRRSSPEDIKAQKRIQRDRLFRILIGLVILIGWEIMARNGDILTNYFPAPSAILNAFIAMVQSGELWGHLSASLSRLILGFLLGGIPAVLLGLLMGWSPRMREIFDPLIAALHPLPKIAILPLIIVVFGIGERSRLVVIAISTFFPLFINTMGGVVQIPPIYFHVANNLEGNFWLVFRRVVFPGSLPMILTGMRIAGNSALTSTIVIEIVFSNNGLGSMIWLSWEILRMTNLYISLGIIILLGVLINIGLSKLRKKLIPWETVK